MEKDNIIDISVFEKGLQASLQVFEESSPEGSLSDIYLMLNKETAVLSIYDDMENLLKEIEFEAIPSDIVDTFRQSLQKLETEGLFEKEYIFKPFAVSLVDEVFIVDEELIFVDDDTLKLEGNLWTDIEKELDDFLKKLME